MRVPDVIDLPVRACSQCMAGYPLAEWDELEALAASCVSVRDELAARTVAREREEAKGLPLPPLVAASDLQWRRCRCGAVLSIHRGEVESFRFDLPRDYYAKIFPESHRPAADPPSADVRAILRAVDAPAAARVLPMWAALALLLVGLAVVTATAFLLW